MNPSLCHEYAAFLAPFLEHFNCSWREKSDGKWDVMCGCVFGYRLVSLCLYTGSRFFTPGLFFFSFLQITDSQADTLEYQVAEALQDLITKNAKNNEIEDVESNDREVRGEQDDQVSDTNMVRSAKQNEEKEAKDSE